MICRILLLIILTSCVSGPFVVNVTQTCYQAEENHNITLEWTFTTKPDLSCLNIFCFSFEKLYDVIERKNHNENQHILYHVANGVEKPELRDKKFTARVQSDKDALREGRIRIQLSRLRTDDSSWYLCNVRINKDHGHERCYLNVTAADQPQPPRPTLNPPPDQRSTGLLAGLITLVLLILCVILCCCCCCLRRQNIYRDL